MTLRLHPDLLAAVFDMLRTTEPFRAWKLPESDDVAFHVVRDPKMYADFGVDDDGGPLIRVSAAKNGHTLTLLQSMAHEMIHLRQYLTGDKETHGPRFQKAAAKVCAIHGFDPKTF